MTTRPQNLGRAAAFGVLAVLAPPVVGVLIALTQPDRRFRLEGVGPLIAACVVLAAIAYAVASAARTQPLAIGTMAGGAFAIGSLVRDRSIVGALIVLAAGAAGGLLASRRMNGPIGSTREFHVLLVVAALLSPPLALVSRADPEEASRELSSLPVLASATPQLDRSVGYVLRGRPGRFFDGMELVRVERRGIGSWAAAASIGLPEGCRYPERIDGTDRTHRSTQGPGGVLMASVDISRACYVAAERVVAGVAPPGTERIEAVTIAGEEVDIPVGVGGAYVVMLEEDTIAANFVRIAFFDGRGTLLDGKATTGPGDYRNIAFLSRLIERRNTTGTPHPNPVTVSKFIVTPAEFERLCGARPPHGDGYVTIGIVRREDGITREVVIGTGMPLSSGHPRPDPPLVRASSGVPCFAV